MKKSKAVVLGLASLMSLGALTGCESNEAKKTLQDAADYIIYSEFGTNLVKSEVELVTKLADFPDVEISYSSSDVTIFEIQDGKLVPHMATYSEECEAAGGYHAARLNCTLTLGKYSLKLDGWEVRVAQKAKIYTCTEVNDILAGGKQVKVEGYIAAKTDQDALIYDGTEFVFIYSFASGVKLADFAIGEYVFVQGETSPYYDVMELKNCAMEKIEGHEGTMPALDYVDWGAEDFAEYSLHEEKRDEMFGKKVRFTGKLVVDGNYYNVLIPGAISDQVSVDLETQEEKHSYYQIKGSYNGKLAAHGTDFNNKWCTFEAVLTHIHTSGSNNACFVYMFPTSVTEKTDLTNAEKQFIDVNNGIKLEDQCVTFDLPTKGSEFQSDITWTLADGAEGTATLSGNKVTVVPVTEGTKTIKLTATCGDSSKTYDVNIYKLQTTKSIQQLKTAIIAARAKDTTTKEVKLDSEDIIYGRIFAANQLQAKSALITDGTNTIFVRSGSDIFVNDQVVYLKGNGTDYQGVLQLNNCQICKVEEDTSITLPTFATDKTITGLANDILSKATNYGFNSLHGTAYQFTGYMKEVKVGTYNNYCLFENKDAADSAVTTNYADRLVCYPIDNDYKKANCVNGGEVIVNAVVYGMSTVTIDGTKYNYPQIAVVSVTPVTPAAE